MHVASKRLEMVGILQYLLDFHVDGFKLPFAFPFKFLHYFVKLFRNSKCVHPYSPYRSAKLLTLMNLPFLILSSFSRYSFLASGFSSTTDSMNISTCLLMLIPLSLQKLRNFSYTSSCTLNVFSIVCLLLLKVK